MSSARSRSRNAQASRARILECATDLFLQRGYEGTSILEVAAQAGYTSGAVYRHFPSKSLLMVAVVRHALAHLPPVLSADTERQPLRSIVALMMTFARADMRDVRALTIALNTAPDDSTIRDMQEDFGVSRAEQIGRLIAAGEGDSAVATVDQKARLVMLILLGLCHIDGVAPELCDSAAMETMLHGVVTGLFGAGRAPAAQ
ncbi:MAG: TetR/AcrR family transcriptional regulator [Sphingobium sp.]